MSNMTNANAYPLPDGRMAVDVDSNKTLVIDDSGYVQNVIADGVIFTLPATASLGHWTMRNGGGAEPTSDPSGNGTTGFSVAPNASDRIQGGVAGSDVDNKAFVNTKATAHFGDEITIANVGETNGPIVNAIKGTWARAS